MTTSAVLFDIDGTLVDSNYLHVEAWATTFWQLDLDVPTWRIHRAIGADASELLRLTIGEADEQTKERAKALHAKNYGEAKARLRLLPGAREIVSALAGRGLKVVLATSAPEEELETLRAILDIEEDTAAITSGEDVETAKPEPDLIEIALERAGVEAGDALMIGDATWDIEAADRAGVRAIGVLSGGTGADDLRAAGAIAVYDDVAALLADLDDSPIGDLLER